VTALHHSDDEDAERRGLAATWGDPADRFIGFGADDL